MSLIQQYQAVISNAKVSKDEVGPLGNISFEDWQRLSDLKDGIDFEADTSTYKGTNFPVSDTNGWQEWWVETNDASAVARVIHQQDSGGFFVSVEFKDEPYWDGFDLHEASNEQCFAVFRMLPSEVVTQIKDVLKSDSAIDQETYLNLSEWIDRAFEQPVSGLSR